MEDLEKIIKERNDREIKAAKTKKKEEKKAHVREKIESVSKSISESAKNVVGSVKSAVQTVIDKANYQKECKQTYEEFLELSKTLDEDIIQSVDENGVKTTIINTYNGPIIKKEFPKGLNEITNESYEGFSPVEIDGVTQMVYSKIQYINTEFYDYGPHGDLTGGGETIKGFTRTKSGHFESLNGTNSFYMSRISEDSLKRLESLRETFRKEDFHVHAGR